MAEQDDTISLDLGESGTLTFSGFAAMRTWYEQEKSYFSSLITSRLQNAQQTRTYLHQRWQPVDVEVNRAHQLISQNQDPRGTVQNAAQQIRQLYIGPRALFPAESPKGQFLKTLVEKEPDDAAAALGLTLKVPMDPQQPSTYRGGVALALFEKGLPDTAESHRESLETVYRDGKRHIATIKGLLTRLEKRANQLEKDDIALTAEIQQRHEERQQQHQQELTSSLEEARQALTDHEQTYSEKLALHSAVKYWKDREARRSKQGVGAAVAFGVALIVAAGFLWQVTSQLLTGDITPQKVAALLLTASPVFWGLRVLARLLLSYIHLTTDAAERHILIETYLALHKEGKVKDEDRELLLATIFRPAATGIVRDDAAPAWSDIYNKFTGR